MNGQLLREFTSARVGLGRAGNGLPTSELLALQLAHARARQAVHSKLDVRQLEDELRPVVQESLPVTTQASDRAIYVRRPDLGRRLSLDSHTMLLNRKAEFDVVFVIADGLSASGVQVHAARMLTASLRLLDPADWNFAPVVIVEQGRVALGDEIGHFLALGCRLSSSVSARD